jgi:crotonobetainyl-CoA:carnitine CoA-transferase CaiB-like acyl-CoA transferase
VTVAAAPVTSTAATTVVNTGAAVVAGAAGAAAVASQPEEESTPWGWIAFGILAAAVLVFAIVWLLRRKHDDGTPSAPAAGA